MRIAWLLAACLVLVACTFTIEVEGIPEEIELTAPTLTPFAPAKGDGGADAADATG